MTAAARKLHVSQPALTVSMQQLERSLQTTLLQRDKKGVKLTSSGEELLHYADEIFALLQEAQQRVQGLEQEDIGHFILGCPDVLGSYFLPNWMASFLQEAPQIVLSLWNGSSPQVYQAVLSREIHFGLIVNALPHPDLVLVPLFRDATDIFVSTQRRNFSEVNTLQSHTSQQDSSIDNTSPIEPREYSLEEAHTMLKEGPLVFVKDLPQSQEFLKTLARQNLLSNKQLTCGTYELVRSLLLSGLGVGIIPRRVAANGHYNHLQRLHPDLHCISDTIFLVYRSDLHRTRAAQRLRSALVEHGKQLDQAEPYSPHAY